MKKSSNFLRSSKDAFTKSFNSAKCKTSLKLASSRLKLLRNKKEVQLKQMKRELAQLLESGQNQTARIRVEHVVREEKMIAAYDLIEIYCELIVARLPIIESQKNCPIDLKEAITSVVFASPRCGDVPELIDVRKHLTAKYGKEFINAAVELRPDCGVSRLLVEKLSAKSPDGQTKLKILTAIAEEQGVKWDPKSFGESGLPPNDLLNGSNTFEKASKIYEDPPHFGTDARTMPNHNQGPYASPNFSEMNSGSSMGMHNSASLPDGMSGKMQSSSSQLRQTHSGLRSERTEVRKSFAEDGNFPLDRKNWNMEFKDAASAARAAAESAEHASLAARAAAELSRVSGQYPTESQRAHPDITRDKEKGNYSASKTMSEHASKDSPNVSFPNINSMLQHNDGRTKQDEDSEKVPISFASSRSRVAIDKDSVISLQEADLSREKSSKEEDSNVEDVMNSQSNDSEHEHFNGSAKNMTSENFNYFGEETTIEDPQNAHYASHPSTSNYSDHIQSSNDQNFRYEASDDLFLNADEGHPQKVNVQISSHYEASAVFDEPNSDDGDDTKFDTGPVYDDQQSTFYFPLPETKVLTYPSILGDSGNPRLNMNKFPENYTSAPESFEEKHSPPESPRSFATSDNSQVENFAPATFDDSDGGSSHSEDIEKPELIRTEASLSQMHPNPNGAVRSSTEVTGTNKIQLSHSSSNESIASGTKDDFPLSHSPGANKDDGNFTQSSSDYGKELNFGKLTGGLRHKHFIPPFMRSGQNDISSIKKPEEIPPMMPQSIASQTVENSSFGINMKKDNESSSRTLNPRCDQDPDSSDEDFSQQISSNRHESDIQKENMEVKTKSSLKGSGTYFDSDSSDSEVHSPRQPFMSKNHLGSAFSQRTKLSSSSSETTSLSSVRIKPETPINYGSGVERKPAMTSFDTKTQETQKPSGKFYASERQEPQKQTGKSYDVERLEVHTESSSLGREAHREQPHSAKSVSKTSLDENSKSSAELPSRLTQASGISETFEASRSSDNMLAREENTKKASHVHPKLPDYDSLAAQLQSLRMNRK
ncbi:PREDICTED: uncharacterized protein LOC109171130 [Ipomoea nil]|uniref:uncharacterized protein LOC109171130 n=1 Tax=Ipomoea nil TaxID=35883 RepID=UPI000901F053|nr:PREDICTED: uncharacterized protein LOC109171130 [Ipomoea nil]